MILRLLREIFASRSTTTIIINSESRPATPEEEAAIAAGFKQMDEAFDAMGKAFDTMFRSVKK